MEINPSPEPKPSLMGRIVELVKDKRNQVVEEYGKSDWKTPREVMNAHKLFMVGTTLAVGFAVLGGQPELGFTAIAPKVAAVGLGLASAGAEAWAIFKLWAVDARRRLVKIKA